MAEQQPSGFKDLLSKMMARRWYITALVLGGFMFIIGGMFFAILNKSAIEGEWKELLLLLLGAFIGSYGKIIDYWFSDTDKDKMLVQKMDEEDGTAMSNIADLPVTPPNNTPLIPDAFVQAAKNAHEINLIEANKVEIKKAVEAAYGVTILAVNTINVRPDRSTKYTKSGLISGKTNAYKKAIVQVQEGETIDFYTNI